ncbi:Transcriptional regulator, AraC family protein [Minicystis rosea]|nr:Transcriptional regulator, AraC family protein [Minicystis rosea]
MKRPSAIRPRGHIDPDAAKRPAFVLADSHGPTEGTWHAHRRAQLVHAAEGVLTVITKAGRWVVPPQRAVWVPGGMEHAVASRRPFRLLTLYLDPAAAPLPPACRVVAVDRLAEELLRAAAAFGSDYPLGGSEERLMAVILDRLPALTEAPLSLPHPESPALQRIAAALAVDPSDGRTLEAWCAGAGMTARTAARRFVTETGMTFGRWRQQLRLLAALERLGAGESVTTVALEVGYEDVSAFIAVFKAAMGETPARYFKANA